MRLHIGAGKSIKKGWINQDIRSLSNIDVIGSATFLPWKDSSFDIVYACHILEHFKRKDILNVLKEWIRVLKVDGILRISVPDLRSLATIFLQTGQLDLIHSAIFGKQDYFYNIHYTGFNEQYLLNLMQELGLQQIVKWDPFKKNNVWDFSQRIINGVCISINLEGIKKEGIKE